MSPESPERRLFDPAAAIDRLRGIGDVTRRALTYCPTLVKDALTGALIGAVAGAMLVGYAFLPEHKIASDPQIHQQYPYQYDWEAISAGNRLIIGHAPFAVAGVATIGVGLGLASRRIRRVLEAFCPELKEPE